MIIGMLESIPLISFLISSGSSKPPLRIIPLSVGKVSALSAMISGKITSVLSLGATTTARSLSLSRTCSALIAATTTSKVSVSSLAGSP